MSIKSARNKFFDNFARHNKMKAENLINGIVGTRDESQDDFLDVFKALLSEHFQDDAINPVDFYLNIFIINVLYESHGGLQEKVLEAFDKILNGAHVCIPDPDGEVYRLFEECMLEKDIKPHKRMSSHAAISGTQFGLSGKAMAEFLYAHKTIKNIETDEDAQYMWFQLEAHSANHKQFWRLGTLIAMILHLLDWIKYKITGNNIGQYGCSEHTDKNPMIIDLPSTVEPSPSPALGLYTH